MMLRCCCLFLAIGLMAGNSGRTVSAAELRTWTDATGKFKIQAKFLSEKDGTVTLEQTDGTELEIELKALSPADQKAIADLRKEAADNPFKPRPSNPFSVRNRPATRAGMAGNAAAGGETSGEPRALKINWNQAELANTAAPGDDWQVKVEAVDVDLPANLRPISLPVKTSFFEKMEGLVINPVARKAVVGFVLGEPKPVGTTRLAICDLATGRSAGPIVSTGQMLPMALSDDGEHVVMRRHEFGFGNHDRLEVWQLTGSQARKLVSWVPYEDLRGGDRDVLWASFVDNGQLATVGGKGELVVWSFPEIEPLCRAPLGMTGLPALSPDRKLIAFCAANSIGILDVNERSVVAQQSLPQAMPMPRLAFSPSGGRLACVAHNQLIVWETTNGNVLQNMDLTGVSGEVSFPHENFVLGGNRYLIDIENQVKLWSYEGHDQVATLGEWTFFSVPDSRKAGALLPARLPHKAARDFQQKVANNPAMFALRPETKVRIDVSSIPDASRREKVTEDLTGRLKTIGCTVDASAPLTLAAIVEGPKQETLKLRNSGDYQVQVYATRVRFLYDGKTIWETSISNVPGGGFIFIRLEEGENVGTWLKKREKPDYEFFGRVELPKYLLKPVATTGNTSSRSLTLGSSRMTPAGIP